MSEHHDLPEGEEPRWLDHAENRSKVYYGVVIAYVGFCLASFLPYEHHPYFAFEEIPAFAGIYGLVCCVGLVLAASWMRTFLMASEDYYTAEEHVERAPEAHHHDDDHGEHHA